MTPNAPDKNMMDCIDSIEEKLTMIMDHLGIQAPEEAASESEVPEKTAKDMITSSEEE